VHPRGTPPHSHDQLPPHGLAPAADFGGCGCPVNCDPIDVAQPGRQHNGKTTEWIERALEGFTTSGPPQGLHHVHKALEPLGGVEVSFERG
jgi:hypothetical protein